ncbi:DUF6602 domain-containing protein [Paraburkholderia fungorum]|uniref:DUF6602 domain-containing protein n=1 Tax=Paraburkholderia fungorum TaxID=134537 RepID=UPI0038780A54
MEVEELLQKMLVVPALNSLGADFITLCVKGAVADGTLVVERKSKMCRVLLNADMKERERARSYAASIASELASMSERIGNLIGHGPTVGSYRESLLQALLRRHVPTRYHVATGFIHGCPRQVDILIYDQVDYAPTFREGDLVVVQPEAVRAVIEVKTTLDPEKLKESLSLLEDVSPLDDMEPPFFKGIFAFKSPMDAEAAARTISKFYEEPTWVKNPSGGTKDEIDKNDPDAGMHDISQPFWHLTSLCVLEKVFLQVNYVRDRNAQRWDPVLHNYTSATGLNVQAPLFLSTLLSYLRVKTLKPAKTQQLAQALGADVMRERIGALTDGNWSAYALAEPSEFHDPDEDALEWVKLLEYRVTRAQQWLAGQDVDFK